MKNTPLEDIHRKLGAKMTEFAGYNMPLEYSGVTDEHNAVRKSAGLFDVSHMGEFLIKGPKAYELVQKITSNDIQLIDTPGKIQYSCLPNGKGGIVDDLLVYHLDKNEYMFVVNAANREKDWNWINTNNDVGAEIIDNSESVALLALQGPKATEILQKITPENLFEIKFYTFKKGTIAGVNDIIISATGYTGSGGFELFINAEDAKKIWESIIDAATEYTLKPAGLAARDTLRLETGLCLYGNDIDETTSPIEGSLSWITKFNAGNNFIDRQRLEKQKQEGVPRKLRAFKMIEKGIPRQGYKIFDENTQEIGEVTSGTMSPVLKEGIGMGYLKRGYTKKGTKIYIKIRKKYLAAQVVKTPFIDLKQFEQ